MKKIITATALFSIFFASCEKVVNIDLNETDPQYVIEGKLFEGTNPVTVKVSRTTDYYNNKPQELVNDAEVLLFSDSGDSLVIPATGGGMYELPSFTASTGVSYRLRVRVGGREFNAISAMPAVVPIDSMEYEFEEEDFRDAGYEVAARFTDPADQKNNYRMLLWLNGEYQNKHEDISVFNDKFNNGKRIRADFFKRFNAGDTIEVALLTMDDAVYEYFFSLDELINNNNGPAPANPVTNITGGAQGYFGAFGRSRASVVIPE